LAINAYNSEWHITGSYIGIIKSFSCLVYRNDKIIDFIANDGPLFNRSIKKLLNQLITNDEVYFIDIIADNFFRKNEQLEPIKLIIK